MADGLPADDSAVLSDLDDDEDPSSSPTTASPSTTAIDHRLRDHLAELEHERQLRRAAEDSLSTRDVSLSRLKSFAQDIIKKRDEIARERDETACRLTETLKERDDAVRELDDVIKGRDGALTERESIKSEVETASQLMASGIDMISGKAARFRDSEGFPRSHKYATGLPAVAYGVIRRANDIVDEMIRQHDSVARERDRAREQIEHRNYEIAIEISQLEAAIAGLREEVSEKEKTIADRGAEVSEMGKEMEKEISELSRFGEENNAKLKDMEAGVESLLSNVSKTFGKVNAIVVVADGGLVSDRHSSFVWEEKDMDRNLQALSEGIVSVYKTAGVVVEKVRGGLEEKERRINVLEETVNELVAEKQHTGTLLRSALSSKTNEVLLVAESGLREAGLELRFDGRGENGWGRMKFIH